MNRVIARRLKDMESSVYTEISVCVLERVGVEKGTERDVESFE